MRQQSSTKHMIRKTASLISYISQLFTLEPGDVILTGASGRMMTNRLQIDGPCLLLSSGASQPNRQHCTAWSCQPGTPEGVGPIKPGDKVTAGLDGITSVAFDVKAAE